MEHILNRSRKYHLAKSGIIADGIFSFEEMKDCIYGLILYFLKNIKEEKHLPNLNLKEIQKQENYWICLKEIKKAHFQKINFKDKNIFLSIFMSLELAIKNSDKKLKI